MSSPHIGSLDRQGLIAGLSCFTFWGLMPLLFITTAHLGAGSFEIVAWRTALSLPIAAVLVAVIGRGTGLKVLLARPRELRTLLLSAVLIATNWTLYVWAVDNGHTLSASLGYYINPLLNMAAGAVLFGERIDRAGRAAIVLAGAGVAVQGFALGEFPWVSLLLAASFCGYGIVRKQAHTDAQTGLLVECVILFLPALAYLAWLSHAHMGVFGTHWDVTLLLLLCGPATVIPLAAFAFSARKLPMTVLGFMQFITPTLQFIVGLEEGETLTPLRMASFGFIWTGAAIFALAASRRALAARARTVLALD